MRRAYTGPNIFLNPVLYDLEENEEAQRYQRLLKKIIKKKIHGITSTLTWDEVEWIIQPTSERKLRIKKKGVLVISHLIL